MLILDSTTKRVRVVLGAAHTTTALRCVTSWRDTTTTAFTPGSTLANTNGTTPVEIAPAPAASTQRIVDFISVFNDDTVNQQVTISVYDGTTDYVMYSVALGPDERLQYSDSYGFATYNSGGSLKTIIAGTNNVISTGMSVATLASDVTNNNATANTIADVTGLSFPVTAANRYWFRFVIDYTAAATTTGSRWSINGPASPTRLAYTSRYGITATSETVNYASAYDIPAASNASSVSTAGNVATIEGFITPSANGTVIARFASEVSSSAIVAKTGSFVQYMQV